MKQSTGKVPRWASTTKKQLPKHAGSRKATTPSTGYRGYGTVDTQDGYVEHIEVHPANEAEVNKLPQVIDAMTAANGIAPDGVLADLIQHKAAKGNPLSPILKKLNTAIGGLRFKVEQAFGTMKRQFHLARGRYFVDPEE